MANAPTSAMEGGRSVSLRVSEGKQPLRRVAFSCDEAIKAGCHEALRLHACGGAAARFARCQSLKHELMEAMWVRERPRTLRGTVQVDEAFLGGQSSGPGSRGRKGKVAFLAAVSEAPDGKAEQVCLSRQPATGEDVVVFCLNTLAPGSRVVSDGAPSFNYSRWNRIAEHEPIVTGGGKQACEIPQLKAVNTVLGNLKTAITGTYHAFKFAKYTDRYLAEYQFRFNRRFDMHSLTQRIIRAAVCCKPNPLPTLRMAEVRR
jgi:hypothetical protein